MRGLVLLLVLVALAGRGDAGPADGLVAALAKAKARVLRLTFGQPEDTRSLASEKPRTLARCDLETDGKPLSPADAAALAKTLADGLMALGAEQLCSVEIDVHAHGRFTERGASGLNRVGRKTESNNPSGALWVMDAGDVDVTKPVGWYLRVVWWRPFTVRRQEVVDWGKWEPLYWTAMGNAVAAGEEGSTAMHVPELTK